MSEKQGVRYLDVDVLTAAKARIRHIYDIFDSIWIAFSGGKDSLAVLHLATDVLLECGHTGKINVLFRDEELIPDDVIAFVQKYAADPQYNFRYLAVPMASHKFILGRTIDYVQWDWNREWLRPKPANAITDLGRGERVIYSQYDMDDAVFQGVRGKVAVLNGIRSDESLVRFRSCVNKRNENYINATESAKVKLAKPIYDWSQSDVFKYFQDAGVRYCSIYDQQLWNGQALRVSTPLHAEAAKRFGKFRTLYPVYYEQLIGMFPEMLSQEKYWDDLDTFGVMDRYEHSWAGILQYIREKIDDPHQRNLARERVEMARTIRENNQKNGKARPENYWGYPIRYVFKQVINGAYKRVIQPCARPTKDDLEYEQQPDALAS